MQADADRKAVGCLKQTQSLEVENQGVFFVRTQQEKSGLLA
ncbi:hypothetical protein C7S14_0750 [Burkholderia cepacia]|nr:hypothetical protein C7S14_0750 [Burkholderia cepacia]